MACPPSEKFSEVPSSASSAWRILYATLLSRTLPEAACTVLLSSEEWQALYCPLHETRVLPAAVPTLRTTVRWMGQ